MQLTTTLAGISLRNPLVLASGIMGVSASTMKFVEENGAGAVTMKSIGPVERTGHHNPTVFSWGAGLTNAVGLSNQGVDAALPEIQASLERLEIPLIASMFGGTVDEFKQVAEKLCALPIKLLELNLSCPNVQDSHGRMFALDADRTEATVKAVKEVSGSVKVFAKLTPEAPNIVEIAKAAEAGGADGITAINTISGMVIDITHRRPILTNKSGGISGPAIKPVGVRAVYNIAKEVRLPIIGTGGVETGSDALEYIMAGATAVGVGSAVWSRGIDVFSKITAEIETIMNEQGITSLDEIRGVAHSA